MREEYGREGERDLRAGDGGAGRHASERDVSGPVGRVPGSGAEGRGREARAGWYAPSAVESPAGPEAWEKPREDMGEELLHIHPGPGTVEMSEDELRERMWDSSPDGRPPSMKDAREARAIFIVGFTLTTVGVLAVLWIWAGFLPMLLGAVLSVMFIGIAAWPTWHAGLDRKLDENRVKHQVLEERAGWGAPPAPPVSRG